MNEYENKININYNYFIMLQKEVDHLKSSLNVNEKNKLINNLGISGILQTKN